MRSTALFFAVVFAIAIPAHAQSPAQTPIQPRAQAEPRLQSVLPEGTPIRMRINRTVSSADMHLGDNIDFETLDDVKVGDVVVIPRQSTAMATVTEAQAKRRMARGGKLAMNIDYVRLPSGAKLPLRGIQDAKGGGHTGAMTGGMVATAIVFWPAAPFFLFMHGKDISIPKGHEVTVYTNTDYDLAKPTVPNLSTATAVASKTVSGAALANTDVLKLKNAGLGDQLIIEKIKVSPSDYHLDANDIIELKRAGLSDAVIGAMLEAPQRPPSAPQPNPAVTAPAAATILAATAPASGLVDVPFTSNPPGALVSFSGTAGCYTPCVMKLESRQFRVTMTLAGYANWDREITVEAGTPVVAEMQR